MCYVAMILIAGFLRLYMGWENRRRDRRDGEALAGADKLAIEDGFKDLTDKEVSFVVLVCV